MIMIRIIGSRKPTNGGVDDHPAVVPFQTSPSCGVPKRPPASHHPVNQTADDGEFPGLLALIIHHNSL